MVKEDLALLAVGALGIAGVLWWINRQGAGTVAKSVGAGAVDAVVGTFAGVGEAVNATIINPVVATVTGEPDATLGGKIWEWTHPEDADALKYGMGLDGKPLRRSSGATATW